MASITVNPVPVEEPDVKLNNGDLVMVFNTEGALTGTFIVTSFRNSKKSNPERWEDTAKYCSLINLANGAIEFEEPCSRATTKTKIRNHITPSHYQHDKYNLIKVIKSTSVNITINCL